MNTFQWKRFLLLVLAILVFAGNTSYSSEAPPKIAAALISKLLVLEKSLMSKDGDMVIYVIGSKKLADALKKSEGKKLGKRTLGKVVYSDVLPNEKPDVLCISTESVLTGAIEYTRKEKVLSITNKSKLVAKGVSLGIGIGDNGKPKILLNVTASGEEGLDWNPAIMKIAKTTK
jgi:YfiR/HmsC-like